MKNFKIAALLVCAAMAAGPFSNYGFADSPESVAEMPEDPGEDAGSSGKVLNIECFNVEFKTRLIDHYPTYVELDEETGRIGDVTVRWTVTTTDLDAYQYRLDSLLPENETLPADERIDMFLAEDSFIGRYVDAKKSVTVPVKKLGITDDELSEMFPYTLEAASDRGGNVRGLTWQCTPGALIYNREIAKKIWGTDSPAEVQKHVKTWDKFKETAETLAEAGYQITSSAMDTFQAYAGNMSSYWVTKEGEVSIPENITAWMQDSKVQVDAGITTTSTMWSSDWNTVLYPEGNVFCCFGPEWMIRYCLSKDITGTIASKGGWAVCQGPEGFFWRGTWLLAARGTDNAELVADIMRTLTIDEMILKNIRVTDGDFVNSVKVMEEDADSSDYRIDVLGGQNPTKIFIKNAKRIKNTRVSRQDEACEAAVRAAAKKYFEGSLSFEEAQADFLERAEKNIQG